MKFLLAILLLYFQAEQFMLRLQLIQRIPNQFLLGIGSLTTLIMVFQLVREQHI